MEAYWDICTSWPRSYVMSLFYYMTSIVPYVMSIGFYDFKEILPAFSSQKMIRLLVSWLTMLH